MMKGVSVYLNIDERRAKKNGKYPIKLMLIHNAKPYRINIGIDLSKEEWAKSQSNKPGKLLDTKMKMERIQQKAYDVVQKMSYFSIDKFKAMYNSEQPKTVNLAVLFNGYIRELKSKEKYSNADCYRCARVAFSNFQKEVNKRDEVELNEIDVDWLERFEGWWLSKGKSITTVGIYMRNLRCIFNRAIEQGLINRNFYPFGAKKYEIPEGRNVKKALRKEQIDQIRNYKPKNEQEAKARDIFLFSSNCFGMNMKDIAMLKYEQVEYEGITFVREKAKSTKRKSITKIFVTLNQEIKTIIDRYGLKPQAPDKYVFGVVTDDDSTLRKKDKIALFKQNTNKYLKRIGKELEFSLTLTTYVARHSAASVLNNNGASRDFIKDKLGHSSTQVTKNYIDSIDDGRTAHWQQVL